VNKILVVDDEKSMRDLLGMMLRKEGYSVTTADSAVQAKQLVESGENFALVISDVSMPGSICCGRSVSSRRKRRS